jgi:hypothetical protein
MLQAFGSTGSIALNPISSNVHAEFSKEFNTTTTHDGLVDV